MKSMTARILLLAALGASVLLVPGRAGAGAAPGQVCAAAKKKIAGKEVQSLEGCDAKAVGKGQAVDGTCTQKAHDAFGAAWDKAEAKGGCFTTSDKTTIDGDVTAHVGDIESTLQLTGAASKCTAAKFKAAAKKAACLLGCHATSQKKGVPLSDPKIAACLQKCTDGFTKAVTKAELKPDCHTTGDAATVEGKIDAFVMAVAGALPTGVTTTTQPVTTTTTTTLPVTTLCCQVVGACIDADSADLPTICAQFHGTVAPGGQVCDATHGTCGAVKDHGLRCCQCPASSPPFPHPNYCFESATSTCGGVCTRVDGGTCDAGTQTCS